MLNGGELGGRKWPGIGFKIDDASNGVILPATDEMQKLLPRTRHSGYHSDYSKVIRDKLIIIADDAAARLANGESMDIVLEAAATRVKILQNRARNILKDKALPLHQVDLPSGAPPLYDQWDEMIGDV